jgi:RNA polymerase sigma factor (sigma-70 family)
MKNERAPCFANLTDRDFYMQLYRRIVAYQKTYLLTPDAEDCALALIIKLWANHRSELEDYRHGVQPESWLRVSALNAAKNFVIERERHQGHDDPYPMQLDEEGANRLAKTMSPEPPLEAVAIAHELNCRLEKALSHLLKTTTSILLRHYVEGETWVEIAASLEDTPDNVRQKAGRAVGRIKKILEADGLDLAELNDYLASMHSTTE